MIQQEPISDDDDDDDNGIKDQETHYYLALVLKIGGFHAADKRQNDENWF